MVGVEGAEDPRYTEMNRDENGLKMGRIVWASSIFIKI